MWLRQRFEVIDIHANCIGATSLPVSAAGRLDQDPPHHLRRQRQEDPSERAAFLRASCGGDETVLREVQSLLSYESDAESFLGRPALDLAPRIVE